MGAISELFRTWPGVVRSDHPVGSFSAGGPLAKAVTDGHDLSEMLGDRSPLGALYRHGAKVLLLGVDHGSNTSLHLGEFRAVWPGKPFIREGSRVLVDGQSCWVQYDMVQWDEDDFPAIGADFEAAHPHAEGPVGGGRARLYSQRDLVDFAAEWIAQNRGRARKS
jgi:aminoglycoside 3-N-acetyltransferase